MNRDKTRLLALARSAKRWATVGIVVGVVALIWVIVLMVLYSS